MYETLIMLKSGEEFPPPEMHRLVDRVCVTGDGSLAIDGDSCIVSNGDAFIRIDYASSDDVAVESREIAEFAGMDCAECSTRYEMHGEDMDMLLFNDYLLILERISATGKFLIFDSAQGEEYVA